MTAQRTCLACAKPRASAFNRHAVTDPVCAQYVAARELAKTIPYHAVYGGPVVRLAPREDAHD